MFLRLFVCFLSVVFLIVKCPNNVSRNTNIKPSKLSEDPTEDEKTKVETVDISFEKVAIIEVDIVSMNPVNVSNGTYKTVQAVGVAQLKNWQDLLILLIYSKVALYFSCNSDYSF